MQNTMNSLNAIFQKAGYRIEINPASEPTQKLLYISNPDGSIRWVWPARVKSPLFLSFYNVSNWKSGLFALSMRFIFWLGLQNRVFRSLRVSLSEELVPHKAFCPVADNWSLFTGTAGPNQKGIFVLEKEGRRSFLKIALGAAAPGVIQNEVLALTYLGQSRHSSIRIPSVLLRGDEAVLLSGLPTGKREESITSGHRAALLELAHMNAEEAPLSEVAVWNETMARLESLSTMEDARLPKGLIRKLKSLAQNLNWDQPVKTGFSHGDFTPWNVYWHEEKLGMYDWELSDPQRPLGFDAFHFVMQQGILVKRASWKEIRRQLENQTRFLISEREFEQYLGLYLVINVAYYLNLYTRQEKWHTQINWLLETWSMAISDLLQETAYQRGTLASDLVDHLRHEPYATLKFAPAFPEAISENSDIDICLNRKTVGKIKAFLATHPLVSRVLSQRRSHMNTLRVELNDGSWLVLDAIWQLKWKHLEMMDIQPVLVQTTVNEAGIKKASARNEAVFTGLFYGLNNAEIPAHYEHLQNHLLPGESLVEHTLVHAPKPKKKELVSAISRLSANRAWRKIRNGFHYLTDSLFSGFHTKGFTVTFSGVDGAGKSTVIETVKERIEKQLRMRVVVLRHRPSLLPILSAWTKGKTQAETDAATRHPRQGTNASFTSSLLRFSYYYADYLFGQFYVYFRYISRGYVVLYDRYYFDFINDGRRSNIQLPAGLTARGYALLRKPELNLFLYADPETILARKQELNEETISELTGKYKQLFSKLDHSGKNARYVAIRNENLEETLNVVMQNVKDLAA